MTSKEHRSIDCRRVELDGTTYVILRETEFEFLCQRAGLDSDRPTPGHESSPEQFDGASLAERLVRRRRVAGLSQAELARRAGVRPETLNRIERGRTTPDFATIRKLVVAMNAAEQEALAAASSPPQETSHAPKKRNPRP